MEITYFFSFAVGVVFGAVTAFLFGAILIGMKIIKKGGR